MTRTPDRAYPTTSDSLREIDRSALTAALCRVAEGDQLAFGVVYNATREKMLSVCITILKSRETAEDVVQIAYVIVWQKAHLFDAQLGSPIAWMATIARNRALDELRSIRRFKARELADGKLELIDPTALACEVVERADQSAKLSRSLAQLPIHYRSAISAAFYGDLTYQEVANRENLPCGTIKSRIRRGILKLKNDMTEATTPAARHADISEHGLSDRDLNVLTIQPQSCRPSGSREPADVRVDERLYSSTTIWGTLR